jgi:hypothetical protein
MGRVAQEGRQVWATGQGADPAAAAMVAPAYAPSWRLKGTGRPWHGRARAGATGHGLAHYSAGGLRGGGAGGWGRR